MGTDSVNCKFARDKHLGRNFVVPAALEGSAGLYRIRSRPPCRRKRANSGGQCRPADQHREGPDRGPDPR